MTACVVACASVATGHSDVNVHLSQEPSHVNGEIYGTMCRCFVSCVPNLFLFLSSIVFHFRAQKVVCVLRGLRCLSLMWFFLVCFEKSFTLVSSLFDEIP